MMKSPHDFFGGLVVGVMLTALSFLFITSLPSHAPPPAAEFQSLAIHAINPPAIARVIDGDTVCVNVQLIDDVWLYNAPMRLQGINCPEINTPEGIAAKGYTEQWVTGHAYRVVLTGKRDKYGRLLGDVAAGDQLRLTTDLLDSGHAKKVSY